MKNIKLFLLTSLFATTLSCVNSDGYGTPDLSGECIDMVVTKQVQDIASAATSVVQQYPTTNDEIIEAYVTSSDEGGNFYKSISMVSVDGTKGFTIPIDDYNLYTKFEPGRKVFVNMKGRYFYIGSASSALEIGDLYDVGVPEPQEVGRISNIEYQNVIKRSCTKVDENTLINKLTIPQLLFNANLHKLIEIDGVQFADSNVGKNYFDVKNQIGGATNNIISDNLGNTLIVRVSEFANFAGNKVPSLNGKIRGVLTKFGTDFQFMVRTENDIKFTNPRVDTTPPIVGNANVFNATLNEPFTSYAPNLANFPKYINDADFGPRYWQVKSFSSNQYIEMSSFNGSSNPGVPCNTFFMVPVDFTAANTFTFKEEMRFYREESPTGKKPLTVYYIKSEDYVAGSVVDRTKLVNITSSFNITYPAVGQAENSFNSAGTYNIPAALTGNGYFVFEYYGTATLTTTVQIDDIIIN